MLEPLIWMFKIHDFKKHFLLFSLIGLVCYVITGILYSYAENTWFYLSTFWKLAIFPLTISIFAIPLICLTGYFWNLSDNIINRENDIIASSIYSNKIKKINKICLPDWNFKNFIWRGISSIFATVLLLVPLYLIINNLGSKEMNGTLQSVLSILVFALIPAFMWNYARKNSITAILNIPNAIHIMGTYTGRYILNAIIFSVVTLLFVFVAYQLFNIFELNNLFIHFSNINQNLIHITIFCIFIYEISIYWLFISAYLLGTIAPTSEA